MKPILCFLIITFSFQCLFGFDQKWFRQNCPMEMQQIQKKSRLDFTQLASHPYFLSLRKCATAKSHGVIIPGSQNCRNDATRQFTCLLEKLSEIKNHPNAKYIEPYYNFKK